VATAIPTVTINVQRAAARLNVPIMGIHPFSTQTVVFADVK
jgi:hypothetical protein